MEEWLPELVTWLRGVGVKDITVRLDKGFYAEQVVRTLQELEVSYLLKVPNHGHVRDQLGSWRESTRAEDIFEEAASVHTSSGRLWSDRLLSLEGRRPLEGEEALDLDTYEVTETAHILTSKPGIHALIAWRAYNAGAVVEQRIEELKQLSVGQIAVDDLAGNRLLWTLGGLAYQLLHLLRSRLSGAWRRAQPKWLRAWLFRTPAKLTRHARQWRVHLTAEKLSHGLLPRALAGLRGPPA